MSILDNNQDIGHTLGITDERRCQKVFNQTWEDGVVKTTVNISKPLMSETRQTMQTLQLSTISDAIRTGLVMLNHMASTRRISYTDYLKTECEKSLSRREYRDPPKKFMGFQNIIQRDSYKLRWFRDQKKS